jgi:transposase
MNPQEIDTSRITSLEEALKIIDELKELFLKLVAENAALKEANKLLKEEIAKLSKNSRTSSKPPSSDITNPASRLNKKGEQKRRKGGQQGRQAKFREAFTEEEVDEVHEIHLTESECPCCHERFEDSGERDVKKQQVVEFIECPIRVDEYRLNGIWCKSCEKFHYPPLPKGVIPNSLCGPRLQSLIAYLKGNHSTSYREIQEFCHDVLKVSLSRGMIAKVVKRVSSALKAPYDELAATVSTQSRLHVDETGWKDNGARFWVWVFCNLEIAFFAIRNSRGTKVLKEILGETFGGALTSDFYSAYVSYATNLQQFCLAHLIRDIKFLTTLPDTSTKEFGEKLLEYFRSLFELWHLRSVLPAERYKKSAEAIQRSLFSYLSQVSFEKGEAATMKKRLLKHWQALFRFVLNPQLFDPTNNFAERIIRFVVRIRRNTQGSRSENGRIWNERIMTVLATCRLQKRSPWDFILQAVNSFYFNKNTPPTLLPSNATSSDNHITAQAA